MMRQHKTILLIDDESTIHSLIKTYLAKCGYRFLSAYTGQQGLDLIVKHNPDLILLDYFLPDLNGDQVYTEFMTKRDYEKFRQIPVIVLTAKASDSKLRTKFLKGGVSAYLQKPFGLKELLNVIENVFISAEIRLQNLLLQADLQKTHDYLESLIHHTPIGILSTDPAGNIIKVNSFLAKMLGLKAEEEILGGNLFENNIFKFPELAQNLDKTLTNGSSFRTEPFDFRVDSGTPVKLIISGVPLREKESQKMTGAIILVQDITRIFQREYELSLISQISDVMLATVDLDELLHLILTAVTAGCAMGFSRAMILLNNREKQVLEGRMGVGPSSHEEAHRIWTELGKEQISLPNFLDKYGRKTFRPGEGDYFNILVKQIAIPLSWRNSVFIQALDQKKFFKLQRQQAEIGIPAELLDQLCLDEFVIVPLIAKGHAIGTVVADNQFSHHKMTEERIHLLTLFANQAGLAIEKTETYVRLEQEKNKLQQAYEELKKAQERLIHAERLATIGKMAAEVAHEIRNPLVTIGGFARLIRKKTVKRTDAELENLSSIIVEETSRLEHILDNILDFSKLSKPCPVFENINKIIDESCRYLGLQEEISEKGIYLHKALDPMIPAIPMDPPQIKQVLLNIIQNALQSMPGGGSLHILSQIENDNLIRVSIKDTGVGISRDILDQLFNPFFTTKKHGIGLGLSISQQIIRSHGGDITVTSEVGKGTIFSFTLKIIDDIDKFTELTNA